MSEITTSKLANTEIVTKPRSDNEIKEYILKIHFNTVRISKDESDAIMNNIFDEVENDSLIGTHEFLYHECLEAQSFKDKNIAKNISKYILSCKKKLENALNIPKILKGFNHHILTLDGVTKQADKEELPRYQKLLRLEYMYEILIRQGLTIINNYYWSDLKNGIIGTDIIEDCIKKAAPIIIYLKHQIEDQVKEELKYDAADEALITLNRKYN
jgi:hypothetical protein